MTDEKPSDGDEHALGFPLPRTLGEVLLRHAQCHPEIHTKTYLARLRMEIVILINAALRNPAYTQDQRFEAASSQLSVSESIDLLSADTALGISYIRHKKGPEGVLAYMRKPDITTCVRVGRQLRMDYQTRLNDIAERNEFFPPQRKKIEGEVTEFRGRPPLSSVARETADFNVASLKIADFPSLSILQERLASAASYIEFGEELGLTREICAHQYSDGKYEMLFENFAGNPPGFLELAVFVRSFCHMNGTQPKHPLVIPENLYPSFETLFQRDGEGLWRLNAETYADLARASQEVFPERAAQAFTCLDAICIEMPKLIKDWHTECLPDELVQTSAKDEIQSAKCIFPNRKILDEYIANDPGKLSVADRLAKPRKSISKRALDISVDKLFQMKQEELDKLVHEFPHAIEWHALVTDETDPYRTADAIRMLFERNTPQSRMLAAHLLLVALSCDPIIAAEQMCIIDVFGNFQEFTPFFKKWIKSQESLKTRLLIQSLPPKFISYFLQYFTENVNQSIVTTIKNMPLTLNFLSLMHVEFWHPQLAIRGLKNPSVLAEKLMDASPSELQKMMELIHIRHYLSGEGDWAEMLSSMMSQRSNPNVAVLVLKMFEYMPKEARAQACFTAITFMEPNIYGARKNDALPDDGLKEENKKKFEFFDTPLHVFLDPESATLSPPELWKGACEFVKLLPPELKEETGALFHTNRDKSINDIFMYHEMDCTNFVFTKKPVIEEEDLPTIAVVCGYSDHRLLDVIIRKARNSSRVVQQKLIEEILLPEDAAKLKQALSEKEE